MEARDLESIGFAQGETPDSLDKERIDAIRQRVKRLERGERDPHVTDWSGAYYGDVYFLLGLLRRQSAKN